MSPDERKNNAPSFKKSERTSTIARANCNMRACQIRLKRAVAQPGHEYLRATAELMAWHVRLLLPYIGTLDVHSLHDATLESFISDRLASGVCATTINRSLEIVRSILTRAARSY